MPIRWRLTLWFCLILFVILVVSDVLVYDLLDRHLNQEVDNRLRAHSSQIHGILNPDQISLPMDHSDIHENLPPINEFASPGIYIQIIDATGSVIAKSNNLSDQALPIDPALVAHGFDGNEAIGTVPASKGTILRIMVSPLDLKGGTLLLEVAESLKPVDETLSQVKWYLTATTLGALVVAAAAGAIMARRALAPVGKITATAKSIEESSDLARRVGHTGPMDELGRLAATFDHMIDHLNRVFESQRYFVADASHELRNPLTVIRGNLDLLKRDLTDTDRQECLRAMSIEADKMTQIANDLLLLAELEPGRIGLREPVDLKSLVMEELARTRKVPQTHRIVPGHQEEITVMGDPHGLRRLVANLLDNAVKYTPENGTVTASLSRDGDWARLEVADTGIGIAREDLPHIFDRFYRADKARSRSTGGSGLGLAIVKGIIDQHGGKVSVASEPGKGSTFTVWLRLS